MFYLKKAILNLIKYLTKTKRKKTSVYLFVESNSTALVSKAIAALSSPDILKETVKLNSSENKL